MRESPPCARLVSSCFSSWSWCSKMMRFSLWDLRQSCCFEGFRRCAGCPIVSCRSFLLFCRFLVPLRWYWGRRGKSCSLYLSLKKYLWNFSSAKYLQHYSPSSSHHPYSTRTDSPYYHAHKSSSWNSGSDSNCPHHSHWWYIQIDSASQSTPTCCPFVFMRRSLRSWWWWGYGFVVVGWWRGRWFGEVSCWY